MKFLVDAQLPYRLTAWLKSQGFDAIHTTELPDKNLTQDFEIARIADEEDRIVITKDSDFFKLNLLQSTPQKLFNSHSVVEMNNFLVVAHRK